MNLRNKCVGLLPLMLSVGTACSDMKPEDDTYNTVVLGQSPGAGGTDDDVGNAGSGGSAGAGGSAVDAPLDEAAWGCLESGVEMAPPTMARITYQVNIVDFDSQANAPIVVPDLRVEVCSTATCDRVLPACDPSTGAPTVSQQCTTISQGPFPFVYLIDLPYRLDNAGLKLTAPGYAQMNYIFGGPMVGTPEGAQTVVGLTIPLLTIGARLRAYRQVGVESVDLSRGTLAVRTLSCARAPAQAPAMPTPPQGQRAPGVVVAAEQEPPAPAVAWSLSAFNQFSTGLVTDARGVAGFLNADARSIRVNGVLPNGEEYGGTTLPVLPDVITLAELRPGLERWGQ